VEKNIVSEIKSLNNCMVKKLFEMKRKYNDDFHPKPLQVEIIDYLSNNLDKVIYQKDLEEQFNISKAAISEVLASMEIRGMITKLSDSDDARKKRIILTEDAFKKHQAVMEKIKQLNDELLVGITDEELEYFIKVIDKLKNNMKKEGN